MTQTETSSATDTSGRELVCYAVAAEPLKAAVGFQHNAAYVAQLIAQTNDFPSVPQRRRTDRTVRFAAYTATASRNGRTRRII